MIVTGARRGVRPARAQAAFGAGAVFGALAGIPRQLTGTRPDIGQCHGPHEDARAGVLIMIHSPLDHTRCNRVTPRSSWGIAPTIGKWLAQAADEVDP